MSDNTQQPQEQTAQSGAINWDEIVTIASTAISALAPLVEMVVPAAAPAVAIATKVIQGVIDEEPAAVALYNQIKSGTPPTAAQLQQFAADYEASYQKLNADISAHLAALP